MKEIDVNAPIIPYEGLGGIKLYSTREELKDILSLSDVTSRIVYDWIEYNIQDKIALTFHSKNDKLLRISTLCNYKGKLFDKVKVGMTEEELVTAEPSFVYDDFQEVWISNKGIVVETDPETNEVIWIAVYIPNPEWGSADFEKGNWQNPFFTLQIAIAVCRVFFI